MKLRLLFILAPCTVLSLSSLLFANVNGALPKLTGGFKEGNCTMCHNGFDLNQGRTLGGMFRIEGVPKQYKGGQAYRLKLLIGHPGLSRWGFELAARFQGGAQAGELQSGDGLTQLSEKDGIQYITHTEAGTRLGETDGPVEFTFNWVAPVTQAGSVFFNAAGNAANGDNNTTGDYIYTAGAYSGVQGTTQITSAAPVSERNWSARVRQSPKVMNLPAPVDLDRGSFEFHIQHRFLQPLSESRPGNAFGIDNGANISLGLNVGITDRISAGIARARFDQILSLSGTYEIQTAEESWWKMSLHGGVDGKENFQRQYTPFVQLATAFDYKAFRFHFVPTGIFNSRDDQLLPFLPTVNPGDNHTFSLGFGADVALSPSYSVLVEYVRRVAGFGGFANEDHGSLSGGVEIRTWGHVFSIMVSSSQDFTPGTYGVNAGRDNVSLGFNIYRRIR